MHRTRAAPRADGRDQGSTTVQIAILFPITLLLLFSIVHIGLWWHARNTCLTAAQTGLATGRLVEATPADAEQAGRSFLDRANRGALSDPVISAAGSTDLVVQVTCRAQVPGIVPGLTVAQTVHGAKERYTRPGDPGLVGGPP